MARTRDGVEIAYTTHGPPTSPRSGAWLSRQCHLLDHQVDYLAVRHHVITVDLGGHGESGLGRTDWNLAAFGDDVVAVVDEVGAQKVALVGHSMGGDAVVFAARQLGDRVVGLVWVDAFRSLGTEPVNTPEQVDDFLAPFRDDFPGAVDQFVRNLFPLTPMVSSSIASRPTWPPSVGTPLSARWAMP